MTKSYLRNMFFLMLLGFAGSYYVSLPKKNNVNGTTNIVSIEANEFAKIVYQTSSKEISLELIKKRYWITTVNKKDKKETLFLARNDQVLTFLNEFKPLKALREIDQLKEEQSSDFGFNKKDKDRSSLTLILKTGKSYSYDLGVKNYASNHQFFKSLKTNKVYLINTLFLMTLERAESRLFEKNIFKISSNKSFTASIKSGSHQLDLAYKKDLKTKKFNWYLQNKELSDERVIQNWMQKMSRLHAVKYATKEQVAKIEQEPLIFSISSSNQDSFVLYFKKVDFIKDVSSYWVKSKLTADSWVNVLADRASSLEKDLGDILNTQSEK